MFGYNILDQNSFIRISSVYKNSYEIGKSLDFVIKPNEIVNYTHGLYLNLLNDYVFHITLDPLFNTSLTILNNKDKYDNLNDYEFQIQNISNNEIIIHNNTPLFHLSVSNSSSKYFFNRIISDIMEEDESAVEQVDESAVEQVDESVVEHVAESVAEQVAESVAEQVAESVAESVVKPVAKQVDESVAEQVAESVVESVGESVVESVVESVAESVGESVAEIKPDINKRRYTRRKKINS